MRNEDKADIINAIERLERRIDEIEDSVNAIRNQLVTTTENGKFKVVETYENHNGELDKRPPSDEARKVYKAVMERQSVTTQEFNEILMNKGVDRSLPTVRNIMRRFASSYETLELYEAKKGVRKSHTLKKA